ncbi:hypothetical protein [Streptomyces decoyicus]|uniref:hypothetical protein n=1 Tax=Streptomyces decoyicus TaxID=249567 RepID=UPI002DD8815A|nr:hypothetical protein [Streptomyces decoyicus]
MTSTRGTVAGHAADVDDDRGALSDMPDHIAEYFADTELDLGARAAQVLAHGAPEHGHFFG